MAIDNFISDLKPNTVRMSGQKVNRLVLTKETLQIHFAEATKTLPVPQISDVFIHRDEKKEGGFSVVTLGIWCFIALAVYAVFSGMDSVVPTVVALICVAIGLFLSFASAADGLNVTLLLEMHNGEKFLLKSTDEEETLGLIALDIKAQL